MVEQPVRAETQQDDTSPRFGRDGSGTYYAACCQTAFPCPRQREEIPDRVDEMCEMIKRTITGYEPFYDVRLLVFPEYAHAAPVYETVADLREKLAVPVPGEHTRCYERVAREYGCYIQTGSFIEIDERHPDVLFNTTLLIGPEGILSKYRKLNPWIPWEVHASPHDLPGYDEDPFPVVETPLGRIGTAICYDWAFPETIREFAFRGAEVMTRVSAYMDPWGAMPPMDWWTLINRTRALENMVCVVAANQGATAQALPPFTWPGSSMVVDYEGRVLAQAEPGPGEKIVVGPVDLNPLREARDRRVGHDMRAHLRTGLHTYLREAALERARGHPITVQGLRHRIRCSKDRLGEGRGRHAEPDASARHLQGDGEGTHRAAQGCAGPGSKKEGEMEATMAGIGTIAGQIWDALSENGEMTPAQIRETTQLGEQEVHQGIGWLAREGKLQIEQSPEGEEKICLSPEEKAAACSEEDSSCCEPE
jgi:predicted amidohydrolase